jgi:hypothetical protein
MTAIDRAALDAAETFMLLNARLIERHRFAHLFRGAPGNSVVAALAPYANADGGFGHGLEPDLRGTASQPEPVAMALRILAETGTAPDGASPLRHPLARAALDYLASVAAPDCGVPWVLPTVVAGPRGPWWQPEDGCPGALVPTASIAGLLHAQGDTHPWLEGADRFCRRRIEAVCERTVEIGPYDALAILDFLDHVPDRDWAASAFARVREPVLATVTFDPATSGHVHLPLEFAATPDGFGRRLFDDETIDRHLDLLVADQSDDGGWSFNWEAWAPATVGEWEGIVTVKRLKTLRAHGRWAV